MLKIKWPKIERQNLFFIGTVFLVAIISSYVTTMIIKTPKKQAACPAVSVCDFDKKEKQMQDLIKTQATVTKSYEDMKILKSKIVAANSDYYADYYYDYDHYYYCCYSCYYWS
jgi:capsular polysaccharide biosynthesis protein